MACFCRLVISLMMPGLLVIWLVRGANMLLVVVTNYLLLYELITQRKRQGQSEPIFHTQFNQSSQPS